MVKEISGPTLGVLNSGEPVQPYLSVQTFFGTFTREILEISPIDSTVNLSGNTQNTTVSVKLDDTKGALKRVIDNFDIHKTQVKIYQHFQEVGDSFLIFEGLVNSPIVWSEGERTLSFDIVSRLEDNEVGFSPEDGQFKFVKEDMIGKAWPICFGENRFVPLQRLSKVPTGILKEDFGFPDPGLMEQAGRLSLQLHQMIRDKAQAEADAGLMIFYAALSNASSFMAYRQDTAFTGASANNDNNYFNQEAVRLQEEAARLGEEIAKISADLANLQAEFLQQDTGMNKQNVIVSMDGPLPDKVGSKFIVRVNSTAFSVKFEKKVSDPTDLDYKMNFEPVITYGRIPNPDDFALEDNTYKVNDGKDRANITGPKRFEAGSSVTIMSGFTSYFIASANQTTVTNAYAYRSYNGLRNLTKLPSDYWYIYQGPGQGVDVDLGVANDWYAPVIFVMKQDLTTITFLKNLKKEETLQNYQSLLEHVAVKDTKDFEKLNVNNNEDWENDIYVDLISDIGSNTVDQIQWIIENFTNLNYDEESFGSVRSALGNYPSNFMLFEKKNLITLLSEMAYQSRCAIWLKEDTFYLKYLPSQGSAIDTISDDDIEYNSLEVIASDTEDLVTKAVATWKGNYLDELNNKEILKYNIGKYGLHTQEYDYYIYNIHYLVKKSLGFWLIRNSHTWKKIRFRTPLHKIHLEVYDTVTIALTHTPVADTSVSGVIESAVYNKSENQIEFVVWLPVLYGKMTEYDFAFPGDIAADSVLPIRQDVSGFSIANTPSGRLPYFYATPGGVTSTVNYVDELDPNTITDPDTVPIYYNRVPGNTPHIHPADAWDNFMPVPRSVPFLTLPPKSLNVDNPIDIKDSTFEKSKPAIPVGGAGAQYGTIVEKIAYNVYQVELDAPDPTTGENITLEVEQLQIHEDDELPLETKVIVFSGSRSDGTGFYYMQAPVWLE